MILHGFSLPAKQIRIDTYNFRLMSVLVIPQLKLCFFFNLRPHIVADVTRIADELCF